ncbi:MAG: phosphoglycerate kinase [Deltaproteobacteria bacterium]
MTLRSIRELKLGGRRVLIRVDFNVPLSDGRVGDGTRIRQALETIRFATRAGARVVLASHLGRPRGVADKTLSLAPVAEELGRLLGKEVAFADDCIGPAAEKAVAALADGQVLLLENLRFHTGEEANDPDFARALAGLADVYINDAFGTAHRAHASTAGIVGHTQEAAAGLLMEKEIRVLSALLERPAEPFVAIVGGAKVSDKIALLENLLSRASSVLVGGAMAYTLLKARGYEVGDSRVEEDRLAMGARLMEEAEHRQVRLELPQDHIAASEFVETAEAVSIDGTDIPAGLMGLDIGPATRKIYAGIIKEAGSVLWNGPMGVFEWQRFSHGTMAVAAAIADSQAVSIVGGGDSMAALAASGRSGDVTHVSSGGGASLEFLAGQSLPGIAALEDKTL